MPLLSSLGLPCLAEPVLKVFAEAGIKTVEDLFFTEKLKRCTLEESQIQATLSEIETHLGATIYSAEEMIQLTSGVCASTGLASLDQALSGGVYSGQVLEIAGTASSGKTQFCMYLSMLLASQGQGVYYIDSSNAFSSKRISEMYFANPKVDSQSNQGTAPSILEQIRIIPVFDAFVLMNVLHQIKTRCDPKQANPFDRTVRLLVIDSISNLLTPILGGVQKIGQFLLGDIGRLLKEIAIENDMIVLMTNAIVSKRQSESQLFPGLGFSWAGVPSTRINFIQHPINPNLRIALSETVPGLQAFFEICSEGLKEPQTR